MLPVWCRLWGLFLSTPSARRATAHAVRLIAAGLISIHALREEGDGPNLFHQLLYRISIHALREEGDPAKQSTK